MNHKQNQTRRKVRTASEEKRRILNERRKALRQRKNNIDKLAKQLGYDVINCLDEKLTQDVIDDIAGSIGRWNFFCNKNKDEIYKTILVKHYLQSLPHPPVTKDRISKNVQMAAARKIIRKPDFNSGSKGSSSSGGKENDGRDEMCL